MIVRTGHFATADEVARVLGLRDEALRAPVIRVGRTWLHESAHAAFRAMIDELAMVHGLDAPPRDADGEVVHYGMTDAGEFTRWEP